MRRHLQNKSQLLQSSLPINWVKTDPQKDQIHVRPLDVGFRYSRIVVFADIMFCSKTSHNFLCFDRF